VLNYNGLSQLMNTYASRGFTVLAFPCGQFENQEPGENSEILNCLKFARPGGGYVPNFPLFSKAHVNGQDEMPLYTWLKSSCAVEPVIMNNPSFLDWSPVRSYDITWNFAKFLLDKKGNPFRRYNYLTPPGALGSDIEYLLQQ